MHDALVDRENNPADHKDGLHDERCKRCPPEETLHPEFPEPMRERSRELFLSQRYSSSKLSFQQRQRIPRGRRSPARRVKRAPLSPIDGHNLFLLFSHTIAKSRRSPGLAHHPAAPKASRWARTASASASIATSSSTRSSDARRALRDFDAAGREDAKRVLNVRYGAILPKTFIDRALMCLIGGVPE